MDLMGLLVNKESGCAVVGGSRGSMWRRSGRITLVNGLCANKTWMKRWPVVVIWTSGGKIWEWWVQLSWFSAFLQQLDSCKPYYEAKARKETSFWKLLLVMKKTFCASVHKTPSPPAPTPTHSAYQESLWHWKPSFEVLSFRMWTCEQDSGHSHLLWSQRFGRRVI